MIPAILGALEGWFEAKWEQMMSHRTPPPPMQREEMCGRPPAGRIPGLGRSAARSGRDLPRLRWQPPTTRGYAEEEQPELHRLHAE